MTPYQKLGSFAVSCIPWGLVFLLPCFVFAGSSKYPIWMTGGWWRFDVEEAHDPLPIVFGPVKWPSLISQCSITKSLVKLADAEETRIRNRMQRFDVENGEMVENSGGGRDSVHCEASQ